MKIPRLKETLNQRHLKLMNSEFEESFLMRYLYSLVILNSTTIKNQKKLITQKRKTIHFTFRCNDQWTKLRRAVHRIMQMARCTPAPIVSPPPPPSRSRNMDSKRSLGRNEGGTAPSLASSS